MWLTLETTPLGQGGAEEQEKLEGCGAAGPGAARVGAVRVQRAVEPACLPQAQLAKET